MIQKINHIGIVVKDLAESVRLYRDVLGLEFVRYDKSPGYNVDIAFFLCGEVLVELLCPYGPGINQDYLDKTGGGIHHICYEVEDIEAAHAAVKDTLGCKQPGINSGAGGSRIFFIDPARLGNVETEFASFPAES